MIVVRLYGHLAKRFGRAHMLDVRTPREAIRALCANFRDFRRHVIQHNLPGYHVRVGKEYRDVEGLDYPADGEIKIIPAVAGAGNGVAQTIIGVILIVVGVFTNNGYLVQAGIALTIGGVAQMLFRPPDAERLDEGKNKPNYGFDGPVNTIAQGNPVPICYGHLIVGSQILSAGFETSDLSVQYIPPGKERFMGT